MRRLRVCAKDGMFGFELAEGGGRLSRPYRFLYIRRNGSSVKNEPSLGRRGRIREEKESARVTGSAAAVVFLLVMGFIRA